MARRWAVAGYAALTGLQLAQAFWIVWNEVELRFVVVLALVLGALASFAAAAVRGNWASASRWPRTALIGIGLYGLWLAIQPPLLVEAASIDGEWLTVLGLTLVALAIAAYLMAGRALSQTDEEVYVFQPTDPGIPVESSPSGLQWQDVETGKGPLASPGRTAVVHYTGWLEDGTQFDSSRDRGQPFSFSIGAGRVIKGWDEGVQTMRQGGRRRLIIPAELGYGAGGAGPIPGGATLVFDVELVEVR